MPALKGQNQILDAYWMYHQKSNKNPHIDGDNLYASHVECIKVCEPECMERKYIQDQIKRAEKVLEF